MRYRIEHERIDGFDTTRLLDTATGGFAQFAPALGFNMFRLHLNVAGKPLPILLEPPSLKDLQANPSRYGHPVLFPFPNRIRNGRFVWKGREFATPVNASGHAIHGYALRSGWRVSAEEATDSFARIEAHWRLFDDAAEHLPHWPADAKLRLACSLEGGSLAIEAVVSNPGLADLPWGLGFHTYFRFPFAEKRDASQGRLIFIPASQRWELDGFLPTGRKTALPPELDFRQGLPRAGLKADDVLTGLEHDADGSSECRLVDIPAGWEVYMRSSKEFSELVVFTPSWNDQAIALEPYTQTTDAINLAARGIEGGLRVLPPGDSVTARVVIGTRPITGA